MTGVAQVYVRTGPSTTASYGRGNVPDPVASQAFRLYETATSSGTVVGPAPFVLGTTQPDATNTGRPSGRPALTIINGNYTPVAGETVTDKHIKGQLIINQANVTARYNVIEGRANPSFVGEGLVLVNAGATNALVEFNDIGQTVTSQTWYMNGIKVSGGAPTINRNNIHDVLDGIYISTNTTVVTTANYFHDFMFRDDDQNQGSGSPANWSHNDGMQIRGGQDGLVRGNYFRGTFSDVTGMPATANPTDSPPYLWRNHHLMLVQAVASQITNLQIVENWFGYGSIGIQFANNGSYLNNTASMSGNRIVPNQSLEFSNWRQFLVDSGSWTVTGIGSTVYMNHPDTPSADIGVPLYGYQTGTPTSGSWAYAHAPTPSPNGPDKPFV